MGVNAFTTGQNMENTCFYCYNHNPDLPPHWFHNQCPWYQRHVAMGTAHLNKNNRLCLGLLREGTLELRLERGKLHGEQVQLHTAGTEYDENVNDHPKKEVSV